ncbi:MAG TPA: alpha/beta hydrolase, partial [Rhizobacter sp.]|nr:alpha/beta hydrolase [Rhizobacter sp.]
MQSINLMRLAALAISVLLASCGGDDDSAPVPAPEETRAQDSRNAFAPLPAASSPDYAASPTGQPSFTALTGTTSTGAALPTTDRWTGVLNGAAYRVEVPTNWNGKLVMYAHGYAGTGNNLAVNNPSIRRYLIENGYAWAASSYSKNYYDVRVGVEDTNALALEFTKIAAANSRPLSAPTKIFITGHSMGGHITAAAIEDEAAATAVHKVKYNGAVPMCGVVGDTELFNEFAAMQVTAQALAGVPAYPTQKWIDVQTLVTGALFSSFAPAAFPTASIVAKPGAGAKYVSVLQNITGGQRPMFAQGLAYGQAFFSAYGTFVADQALPVGSVTGILNKNVLDTTGFTYTIDGDADASTALNTSVQKITPAADANRLRTDGLRWVPKVNGEFKIPVVSIHTLGDLFVPFSMEQ